jgi:cytochrome P450 family 89 subfamily A
METRLFLLCATTVAIALVSLSLVLVARGRKNRKPSAGAGRLPPGPPALLFLAKFLALRRSIFDLAPLLRDLHARYDPVISVRLTRTLVFVADRRLAHRLLVQGGATFADRPPPVDPSSLFTAGGRDVSSSPYGAYWRLVRRNLALCALFSCLTRGKRVLRSGVD